MSSFSLFSVFAFSLSLPLVAHYSERDTEGGRERESERAREGEGGEERGEERERGEGGREERERKRERETDISGHLLLQRV